MTAAVEHLCECGCGEPASIARRSDYRTGAVRGQPMRFRRGHGSHIARTVISRHGEPFSQEAGDYAERLTNACELIIGAVHFESTATVQDAIDRALIMRAPEGTDPAVALCIALAAQVDPDASRSQRLGWTDQFTGGAA